MQRYERTRILIEGDPALAQGIAAQIESGNEVEVLDEPHEGLVMIKVRESARNSLFYLGEALMCSCRVRLGGVIGYGMVLGSRRNTAYKLALIDAGFLSEKNKDRIPQWEQQIREEAQRLAVNRAKDAHRIEKTRVDFSTMKEEA